ncbi:MAG: septal ring lytic transglycosylase RlpA family protein [Treponema sp.]|jgi:rare lipoprotein A|nr:septal ring lytic transglycosylase RlpA family protein [Treponema sp.]
MKKYIIIIIGFAVTAFCFAEEPFHEEGLASWYGDEFDGQNTASGEKFDSSQFTAAHPWLPFGTLLIITNQYNRKQVTVRVNDRGPFVSTRIIDLSKAAAEQIDMIAVGTTSVAVDAAPKGTPLGPIFVPIATASTSAATSVETVPIATEPAAAPIATASTPATTSVETVPIATEPAAAPTATASTPATTSVETVPIATEPAAAPTATASTSAATVKILPPTLPTTGTNKKYRIQIGAFGVPNNAIAAFNKLKTAGLTPSYERNDKDKLYRVVLSGIKADDFVSTIEKIGKAGFKEVIYREEL